MGKRSKLAVPTSIKIWAIHQEILLIKGLLKNTANPKVKKTIWTPMLNKNVANVLRRKSSLFFFQLKKTGKPDDKYTTPDIIVVIEINVSIAYYLLSIIIYCQ